MKIKNVMFSGFAAAIFAGVCGAANAETISLISKNYADTNLQPKLKVGDNIAIDSQTNTISATGLATTTYVNEELAKKQNELQLGENLQWVDGKLDTKGIATADGLAELEAKVNNAAQKTYVDDELAKKADATALENAVSALEEAIAKKQDGGEYLVAADLKTLEDAVEALRTGKADAQTVATIQETISKLGDTYASDSELAAAIEAVELKIPTVPTNVSAFNNDAGYLVSADLSDYAKTADVSANLASAVSALEDSIALKAAQSDMTAAQSAIGEAQAAITALQTGKADAQTVTNLQNAVNALGDTYATDAELKDQIDAVKVLINNIDLSDYATTTYVNEELAKKQNELQLGENLQWVDGKLDTKGIATADGLAELEAKVNNAAQKTYVDGELAKKADSVTVADDIATALQTAKTYADENDADTVYDDSQVTADIAANAQAIALKANSADVYTKGEVDAAIEAIEEYDDTALAARVSTNEGAISTNATGIADNKSAIEALQGAGHQTETQVKAIVEGYGYQTSEQVQNAITTSTADMVTDSELAGMGYVVGTKTAGSYLVNFDSNGNASYAAVEILDDKGNPIDLTSGAVK